MNTLGYGVRGRFVARMLGVAAAATAMIMGGCGGKARDYNLVVAENTELRNRNQELESALGDANTRNASLEEENRNLAGRLDRGGGTGDTGFEGIPGVSAYRGAGGEIVLTVAGDVLFDSGAITLKSQAKRSLDQVAGVIRSQYGSNPIRVDGYTDSDPIKKSQWKTNERLSAERALAVEDYLSNKGIDRDRIIVAAHGPSNPKANKKDSRRVEIIILAAAG